MEQKQLFKDEVKVKGNVTNVKYAFEPESYSVHNYYEFIPRQVKNVENDIKEKFSNKHKRTYKKLKMEHIVCSFIVFKCDLGLDYQDDINSHYSRVHNFSSGGVYHLKD